jgi:hypothetical protein
VSPRLQQSWLTPVSASAVLPTTCTAYVHVQKDKRDGIGAHMEKAVFMGYPAGFKAWKFWNPTAQRLIIAERAEFEKRSFPTNKPKPAEQPPASIPAPALDDIPAVPALSDDSEEFTVWPTASQPPE